MAKKKPATRARRDPVAVPQPSTVIGEFSLLSPKGRTYTVKRTTQRDVYDKRNKPTKAKP
jgi:hypothetical protein